MALKSSIAGIAVSGLLVGGGVSYVAAYHPDKLPAVDLPSLSAWGLMPGCNIKGNVSINSGERIYHVPGQKFYRPTRIQRRHGEQWFCTENEARAAGWRRARR